VQSGGIIRISVKGSEAGASSLDRTESAGAKAGFLKLATEFFRKLKTIMAYKDTSCEDKGKVEASE